MSEVHADGEANTVEEMATQGVALILADRLGEAERFFRHRRSLAPLLHFGDSFLRFLRALMSSDPAETKMALAALRETQRACEQSKSAKHADKQVIVADCLLAEAILLGLSHSIADYVKAAAAVRRAWGIYDRAYKDVAALRNSQLQVNQSNSSVAAPPLPSRLLPKAESCTSGDLDSLFGSVLFGWGVLQVCMSMVPSRFLRLMHLFGLTIDREAGLAALERSSALPHMKASLCTLALLWYKLLLRPILGVPTDAADERYTKSLLGRLQQSHPNSALLFYFCGKAYKLQGRLQKAEKVYHMAVEQGESEVALLSVYDLGWCQLLQRNFLPAAQSFRQLGEETDWSKAYYGYLTAVTFGASGDIAACTTGLEACVDAAKRKGYLEKFVAKRLALTREMRMTPAIALLLTMEVAYLWNFLAQAPAESLRANLLTIAGVAETSLLPLRLLLEAVVYKQLGQMEAAETRLRHLSKRSGTRKFITAYAQYELGHLLYTQPEKTAEGRKLLRNVKDKMKDFEFETRLHIRVNEMLSSHTNEMAGDT